LSLNYQSPDFEFNSISQEASRQKKGTQNTEKVQLKSITIAASRNSLSSAVAPERRQLGAPNISDASVSPALTKVSCEDGVVSVVNTVAGGGSGQRIVYKIRIKK